jgi:methylamine dehydrogenase accessory protein MauD
MNEIWIASIIFLWIVVAILAFGFLALARQIGMIHDRLGPVGARLTNDGLKVGAHAPVIEARSLQGELVRFGGTNPLRTLVLFISTECSVCRELMPGIRTWHRTEQRELEIVLVCVTTDEAAVRAYMQHHKIDDVPLVISPEVAHRYQVRTLPLGVVLDRQGVIRAKGIVSGLAHLESLLHADELRQPAWNYTGEAGTLPEIAAHPSRRGGPALEGERVALVRPSGGD